MGKKKEEDLEKKQEEPNNFDKNGDSEGMVRGDMEGFSVDGLKDFLAGFGSGQVVSEPDTNFVQAAIPRFDGHYDHWSMLMENFLRSKEYWQVVESGVREPAKDTVMTDAQKTELEGRKLKDLKAKNYLFQAIDRPILETILSKETSKDIWDSMKKKYQGSSRVKRAQLQALRRDFEVLQMKDGESITSYCARTIEISNKMRFHGEKMEDVTIVEKILHSLTTKFDYVVCSIEESKDIDALSLDELQSSLLVHEQKMNRSSAIEEQALKTSTYIHSSNSRGRGRGKGRGRGRGDRGNRDGSRHFKADDDHFEGKGKGRGRDQHMTSPSAGQLQEKGYIITIQQGACEIYDPIRGAIVVVEMSSNRLFPLKIESVQSCLMTEVKDSSWLWHFRYGHLSFGGLKTLQQKNMVTGLPQIAIPSQVCEEYEKRKKLDDKSEKCVFLGVSDVSKAYKLFNPLTKKIVTNRDVVFEEESTWDWNRQ
ncbi:hypothetical protein RJ639_018271 [Escallonia herrerae]|uniref:Retroviral polymerase SH3-like domain-containing protein n=1 Tax=Escallonia herrerae TaxID=1293975 RepID=A0AA88V8B0_9ASTE|nr:hypothetical protein RJ639_018271 [Escallonia herrerae]